jgi:CRISPR-associated protein Csx14
MTEAIFVTTLGVEPQVVTLGLDKLLSTGVSISRVIVVHTLGTQEPIRSSLDRLHEEFHLRRRYGTQLLYVPHLLTGPQGPIQDVVTTEEIDAAFQNMYALLRQHKQAGRVIHLCIAGGRKTIALFSMSAAQILFGPEDRVWHIVSHPRLLQSKQLHTENLDEVTLVSVPLAQWKRVAPKNKDQVRYFIEQVLSPAEREVTELLVREGLSNAALAERLNKSTKTVANQLTTVYAKLRDHFQLSETPDRALLLVLLGSYS